MKVILFGATGMVGQGVFRTRHDQGRAPRLSEAGAESEDIAAA
jgi:hypothetical protein